MKKILHRNIYFYIPAIAFLLLFGIYILSLGKEEAFLHINHSRGEWLDIIAPYITFLGDGWFAAILVVLFLAMPQFKQINLFFAWMSTFLLVTVLKNYIFSDALRPMSHFYEKNYLVLHPPGILMHTSHSFPSGHTASAFAVFAILSFYSESRLLKIIYLLLAALAGWSRIYLGQHFTEDVWIGAAIGLMVPLIILYLFRNYDASESLMQRMIGKFKKMK